MINRNIKAGPTHKAWAAKRMKNKDLSAGYVYIMQFLSKSIITKPTEEATNEIHSA